MNAGEAEAQLRRMVAAEGHPVLDDADLAALLELARRPDSTGRPPGDDAWEGTYDLDAAAAEGWRWKAGKAAEEFGFGEDGQRFDRAQTYAHCVAQAALYANRIITSVPVAGSTRRPIY